MIIYLRLLRLDQWLKNLFVLAPLIFAARFLDYRAIKLSLLSFIVFCFASSSVYIFNDLVDLEKDRLHPVKRYRPLA